VGGDAAHGRHPARHPVGVILRRKHERVAPDQGAVVDRVLCLSVMVMLGTIATALEEGEMDGEHAGRYVTESHRWLRREQLADALGVRERALISKALTDWTEGERSAAARHSESVGILLWALSCFDAIPAYDTPFEKLPALVPLLAPTGDFRAAASLRSADVLAQARETAELAHDRAPGTVAAERQHALNWLTGNGSDWDDVPAGA
jgi:uncharacterized protein DUF4272